MAPKAQFTLEELTKIALGAPELTTTSVHVLHSLIDVILKKLGCQDDTVSICGVESDCLAELLNKSKSTPITFDDKQLIVIAPKLKVIAKLEKSVDKIEAKLNEHIKVAKKFSHLPQIKFNIKDWEQFTTQMESQCIPCEKEREITCALTGDIDFLMKLQRRLAEPMVLNLFEFEQEIAALNDDMNALIVNAAANLDKLATIEGCLLAVDKLRSEIEKHNNRFLHTMAEVQDILDSKLDKVQIQALKQYVMLSLNYVERHIRNIQNKADCPKTPGIITSGVRCLSCADRRVCVEKGVHVTGILPDAHAFKPTRLPRVCKCTKEQSPVILNANMVSKVIRLRHAEAELLTANIVSIADCKATCLESLDVLQGTDGLTYRKG
ncbi:uncharacterized protein LOC118756227 [Rhagoletis pomonella]|uniref:uncharacterized protein LOC118746945 n=1 Tax=Rhagoletis pomonella TaxID=28610 RepID=UPI001782543C|nr:uncharacterized protein LOC118746945 [Rhagoletis pomonella]XP_036346895.1 uncharacterized protein LOC118756227 [Rhagoletis pomonella]